MAAEADFPNVIEIEIDSHLWLGMKNMYRLISPYAIQPPINTTIHICTSKPIKNTQWPDTELALGLDSPHQPTSAPMPSQFLG